MWNVLLWMSLKALLYHVDPIAYTITMSSSSSSNEEKPVKLLSLGKRLDDIS